MAEFNTDGGLEVSPGPRGFSVVSVTTSPDGTVAYFQTDKPQTLNGVALPRGARGPAGEYGDPGEARIRVDTTVGYRVFLWDTFTAGENMVYGDTGVWQLDTGTRVHRSMNTVTTDAADTAGLPVGFRPAVPGATGTYLTSDPWPAQASGTVVVDPVPHRGLEGYTAAVAQGFPGSAQQWIDAVYGVLPTNGAAGQYLGWSAIGPAWMALPQIGPGPWVNVTLDKNWRASSGNPPQTPQVRLNNGTVEFIGGVSYVGATTEAGVWGPDFVKIGTLPPAYAPQAHVDYPVRVFRGDPNGLANYPVPGRVDIDTTGQIFLGAFYFGPDNRTIRCEAGETAVHLGSLPSYALRNSSGA